MSKITDLLSTSITYGHDDFEENEEYIKLADVQDFSGEIESMIDSIKDNQMKSNYSKDDIDSELMDILIEVSY
jgi:hypothetical protein